MATVPPSNPAPARPTITLRAADDGPAQAKLVTQDVQITGTPRRVRVGAAARDAASAALLTVQPDEVVRVEYDNDLVLWTRADDLLRERGRKRVNRSDGSEAWELDAATAPGRYRDDVELPADRGALSLGIKVLEFFGVKVTEGTASLVATKFERRQLGREPGLYRVALSPEAEMTLLPDGTAPAAGRPVLVFLHGTMSSLRGSFGALWSTDTEDGGKSAAALRDAMRKRYGDEVYAFEHRTLSQSPIQNALELVERLPEGAQLHLVSHSRGGLVGELLCLAERDRHNDPLQPELLDQLFKADRTVAAQLGLGALDSAAAKARDAAYGDDRRRLADLVKALDAKRVSVRRFVRVACPARGTTLASGRLDRWLSVLNLIVPDGLFGDVADFLLAVVKERTDPRTIPGVEAMMPGSALTRLLHHPLLKTTADLSVISGDIESKGKLGKLKLLAVDWFYGSDHDLVVNTGSMVGGIARPAGLARFRRDEGEQVTHFNYFRNARSTGWLADALAREDGSDAGFLPIEKAKQEEPRWRSAVRASRSADTPRPIAVVIPGTMGSALDVDNRRVWLAYFALMTGGLGDIGIDAADVRPVDLLDDFYGPLLEHLARTHRVEILPYDWRLSVREAARHLTDKLADLLPLAERTRQPLHIVAHSMGGLVARSMIADEQGGGAQAWRRLTALPGSRLLMLGTPNFGSYEAVRWLTGFNPTQAKLILLDFTRGTNGVIDVVRRFPGVAELLPFDQDNSPWGQVSTWRQLKKDIGEGFPLVEDDVLRQATTTWKLLRGRAIEPEHMVYVAGCQRATVIGHEITDPTFEPTPHRVRWLATAEGDGTVPWASGRLPGVVTYYAPDTGHDELCSNTDDRSIFRGYVDLLLTGSTDQLKTTPPGRARGVGAAPEVFVLPDLPITDDLPDEAALRGLGFGGGKARRARAGKPGRSAPLDVSVRHGDLCYARHPILVGHYLGDTIVSAESVLDGRMRGQDPQGPLSRRRDLGLYPGPYGTHAVFFNERPGGSPEGALVVGLGQVGELSPGRLETGVRDALLEYALRSLQRAALQRSLAPPAPGVTAAAPPRVNARVSALLVGTGAGSLTLRDSLAAMLRGALAANRKLEDAQLDQQVLIDKIEFIELFEDVAIGAAKELAVLVGSSDLGPQLQWSSRTVAEGEGRRRRSRFDADQSWWQRLEITEDRKAEQLRFVATTDRARAEERLATGQLRLADGFIAQACGSAVANPNVSKTLFEMLLPNGLKESAPEQRDMVLLLDEASARFPWELLEDRWSRLGRPPAVVAGMVRQLKVREFRNQPTHAFENTVYVVGNPNLGGWNSFVDLPGARREAERVGQLFAQRGYVLQSAIDAPAAKIVDGLHSHPWRVLHLAGHGEHEFEIVENQPPGSAAIPGVIDAPPGQPEPVELPDGRIAVPLPRRKLVSGMVIGNNTFLTPGDVEQMRHVPELVFVNCCHLGRTGGEGAKYNKLAANLGVQFIRMGVRAVICAGWAVDDAAALKFAETFYTAMLRGDSFGDAVLDARRATWSAHPDANTWGAYQCYGDPDFHLTRESDARESERGADYFSPSELVTDLRNLCERFRMRGQEPGSDEAAAVDDLRRRIDAMIVRIPEAMRGEGKGSWLARADVCAAVGFAYGEVRLFEPAVEWLDKALASDVGDCPVRAAEQAANFKVRLAIDEWSALRAGGDAAKTQAARPAIAEKIQRALTELDVINARAPTAERLSLLGSACKRLAWVESGRPRVEALLNMAAYYRQAFEAKQEKDAYSFNNWAVACLLLEAIDKTSYGKGHWHPALAELCERQAVETRRALADDPQLWYGTGLADLMVVQLLLADGDKARCDQLADAAGKQYAAAFSRGASPREIASVQEHMDFLLELTNDPAAKWPAPVRAALEAVRRAF